MNTRFGLLLSALAFAAACEAPLDLDGVAAENAKEVRRYDVFQAAAQFGNRLAVVSSAGTAIVSDDNGGTWQRHDLAGRPSLIDVTACPTGDMFALDSQKHVWPLPLTGTEWESSLLDTMEDTLSIHCGPNGKLWVTASFATIYWRDDPGSGAWQEFSLYDDLQFTAVRFVDAATGFAVGEFGTVIATTDGGVTWEQRTPIPNDFYPMAADFADALHGWVGGLDGVIWHTSDGAQTWERHETITPSPIYTIRSSGDDVFAVGGNAKLVEFRDGTWQWVHGRPRVLTFFRGIEVASDGAILIAGGRGFLHFVPREPNVISQTADNVAGE